MLGNSTTTQTTHHTGAPAQKPSVLQKLEQVRNRVRFALRAAEEGPLTVSTADDIARTLTAAMRELEALQLTVVVMERKVR
jgi:hypothetical protein